MDQRERVPWWLGGASDRAVVRYAAALAVVALTAGLKVLLAAAQVAQAPFTLLPVAVLMVALLFGLGPAGLATALAVVVGWLFDPPSYSWTGIAHDAGATALFLAQAAVILWAAAALRRVIERRQGDARRLRLIANAVPALISYIDRDFRYRLANEQYYRWFNQTPSRVRGRTVREVLGEAAWDRVRPYMERALAGEHVEFESELPYRDGGARWVRVNYTPDRDESGRVCGFAVLVSDVSAARASDRALRESQALMAVSQQQAHIGSWVLDLRETDLDRNALRWSDETYRIFGYEPGSVAVTNDLFFERTHPDDRDAVRRAVTIALRDRTPYQVEHRIIRPDGEERTVHEWATIELDSTGRPARMLGSTQDITDRKRAEAVVHASEARTREQAEELAAIMGQAPISICVAHDPECRSVVTNPAGARLLAVEPGANVSQSGDRPPVTFRMTDASGQELAPAELPIQTVCRTNEPVAGRELVIEYADGRPAVHVSVNAVPLRDERGACRGAIATLSDITPQKRMQEALRASEERLRSVIENMPVMLDAMDGRGVFLVWNRECERVTGYSAEEIVGNERAWELLYPDATERERLLRRWDELGSDYSGWELTLRAKDGRERIVSWSNISRRFPIPGWATWGIGVDVTESRRAEEALAESEAQLRAIVESAADGILTTDENGAIRSANPAAERILGRPAAELGGRRLAELITRAPADQRGAEQRGELGIAREACVRSADGRELPVDVVVSETRVRGRRLYTALVRDITARKRIEDERARLLERERAARAEAERATRLKDEFLATLGHELRTPLNAILGWTHLLRAATDLAKVARGVDVIDRNARLQSKLVSDLLDLSRITSGKLRLDLEPVDVAAAIETTAESVRPMAEAKGVELERAQAGEGLIVIGDSGRVQQIIWNLLHNAVKFTDRGGRVRLEAARRGATVEVRVQDTGRGIDPAFLPRVFDRFSQADASAAREHGGLGIGLAIVKQLAEMHGGRVRAESPGRGLGSVFSVEFPAAAEGEAVSRAAPRLAEPMAGPEIGGVRVLVVDDEPDALDVVRRVLEEHHAEVETAGSADEALAKIGPGRFDVILSDIGMPRTSGYELISRVRAAGDTTPAAALTAFARHDDGIRALRAGFQAHVSKPVEPAELLAAVGALAGRGASRTEKESAR